MKMLLTILFFSASTLSYPIFYKCSEDGGLTDDFSIEELQDPELSLAVDICEGTDCLNQFKQTLILAHQSLKAAAEVYQSEVRRITDDEYSDLYAGSLTLSEIKKCNDAQRRATKVEDYKINIYYPEETLYQYVTGWKEHNPNDYDGFSRPYAHAVEDLIEHTIKAGVDPLAVLGMAMMERAGRYVDHWWRNMHDKRSQMVLGCEIGKTQKNGLPFIAKNSDEINKIAKDLGHSPRSSSNYLCVGRQKDGRYIDDTKGFQIHSSLEKAAEDEKTCCIDLKYSMGGNSDEVGRKLTTLLYFKQIQNLDHYNPMLKSKGQRSITHRLNTFLGMSRTVGTFPSYRVSPSRVGVNSFEDPDYGRQVMDFQLNSFMRNGFIMDKIKEYSKSNRKPFKSILCVGKKAGNYVIDSDFYLDQIKNSKRMVPIKAKYDQGKSWYQLGIAHQSVLLQEFTATGSEVYRRLKKYLSDEEMAKLDKYSQHLYKYRNASLRRGQENPGPLPKEGNDIFNKVYKLYFTKSDLYKTRDTFSKASRQDGGISWDRATDEQMLRISHETH